MQNALDADLDRVASSKVGDMISITVYSDMEAKRLTVDPAQCVHEVIAAAFGCERRQQVQQVLFGDTDMLKGESFEDHGIEVSMSVLQTALAAFSALSRTPMLLPAVLTATTHL